MAMSPVKQPHKILVVDDEPDVEPLIRQRMRRDIRAGRYEFVFAPDGVEALEMLQQQADIDMVLSDINMPKMDGLTLLQQIPNVDPNVRCVIVSAYGDMENIRTAMNRGAFDFVTKPLDFEDLRVTIDRTLRHLAEWREALASRDKLVVLQNELQLASKMQQSILPTRFPEGPDFRIHGHMESARAVGGDFFDIMALEHGRIGLAIADVSDKGVPAALFMMSTRTLLKGAAVGLGDPGEVLCEVNSITIEPGATLVMYTDGVTEAMDDAKEEFGVERLRAIFAGAPPGDSRTTSQAVFDAVHAFAGDTPQSDDVTCLTLSRGEFGT